MEPVETKLLQPTVKKPLVQPIERTPNVGERTTYPVVEVTWEDASSSAAWHRLEDIEAFRDDPFIARSLGYLVADGVSAVVIAGQINSEGWLGNIQRIPRANIRTWSEVKDLGQLRADGWTKVG